MTALVTARAGRSDRLIRAARWLGRHPVRRMLKLQVTGADLVPVEGPALLVANHSGFLDGPVLFAAAPREGRFLVKSELYSGLLGRVLSRLDQVPVNRGRADRRALRSALHALEAGWLVGVFPEGTRGAGDVRVVQHGVGWLLSRCQVPVVPVAIFGTAPPRPRPAPPVEVVFGRPQLVAVAGDPSARSTMADVAEQVRAMLAHHVATSRTGAPERRTA